MIILGIETSCDETAISIIKAEGDPKKPETLSFEVLADNVLSQIKIHKKYGGVFPMVAKREHAKALVPLFKETLKEAGLYKKTKLLPLDEVKENVNKIQTWAVKVKIVANNASPEKYNLQLGSIDGSLINATIEPIRINSIPTFTKRPILGTKLISTPTNDKGKTTRSLLPSNV